MHILKIKMKNDLIFAKQIKSIILYGVTKIIIQIYQLFGKCCTRKLDRSLFKLGNIICIRFLDEAL